jgi:hypothetical protein
MSKTYLVVPDQHAHPDHNNDRADYLGKFIKDLKPHVVVNIGDAADLASLSTFDKGKHSFQTFKRGCGHLSVSLRGSNPTVSSWKATMNTVSNVPLRHQVRWLVTASVLASAT